MLSGLLSLISLSLALCTGSLASQPQSALSRRDLQQFSDAVLFSRQGADGVFLNIDVTGTAVPAQIDLRSADLFVSGALANADSLPTTSDQADINLSFLNPPITGLQKLLFGRVKVAGKSTGLTFAFNSTDNEALSSAVPETKVHAVLGLGPTGQSRAGDSPLDSLLLDNAANPFFTLLYAGVDHTKPTDSLLVSGFFSVGEIVPTDALFGNSPQAKNFPDLSKITAQNAVSLSAASGFEVTAFFVNGVALGLSSKIQGTTTDAAVAVLSSTSKFSLVPKDVANGIYGKVNGVSFDQNTGLYRLPCNSEITVELQVGSGSTRIPLDPQTVVIPDDGNAGQCVGSFKVNPKEIPTWDHLYGLTFLKNAYILQGYRQASGKQLSQPFIKMLALTDPQAAHADFARVRGSTQSNGQGKPQLSTSFTTITVTHTPTTTVIVGGPKTTPALTGTAGSTSSTASTTDRVAGNVDLSAKLSDSDTTNGPSGSIGEQLKHCLPALIVLVILVALLLIGGVTYCIVSRRRGSRTQNSAYRNLHDAEASDHSKTLYGHDEDTQQKYSYPYTDSH